MRAFLALDLPDEFTDALERLQDRLAVGRHVPVDDFHITLAFLGEVSLAHMDEVHDAVDMMPWPALTLRPNGVDVFKPESPSSLHVRIAPDPGLTALHRKVEGICRGAGIALPRRRFIPHVTLARFPATMAPDQTAKIGRFLQAHGDWTASPFAPPSLSLYRSDLGADGPRYECLARYGPLAAFLD